MGAGILIKLAWRNLLRNKRRTVIAATAVSIGLAALVFVDATVEGMERNMIATATDSFLGEGQIHRRGFRRSYDPLLTVDSLPQVLWSLEQEEVVRYYSPRILARAMVASSAGAQAVTMVGVDPERERPLSRVDEALVAGSYFGGGTERPLVLGEKLAERLEVGVGDKVVLTVAQAGSGDLAQEMFRVAGIFALGLSEMDGAMVFIPLAPAQRIIALPARVHEIAVKFTDPDVAAHSDHPFWTEYSSYGNEALGWPLLMPQLKAAFALSDFSILITALILFALVALGIVNALFMSLYERIFEFGVLRSLGTRPLTLAVMILAEALCLGAASLVLGAPLALVLVATASYTGIDYRGVEMGGVTITEMLRPVLEARQFIVYPAALLVFTVLVACYPAWYAARVNPVQAMRRTL